MPATPRTESTKLKDRQDNVCKLCSMGFSSEEALKEHFWSLLHHRKVEEKNKSSVHNCTVCFTSCTSLEDYGKHLATDKHKSAVTEERQAVKDRKKNPHQPPPPPPPSVQTKPQPPPHPPRSQPPPHPPHTQPPNYPPPRPLFPFSNPQHLRWNNAQPGPPRSTNGRMWRNTGYGNVPNHCVRPWPPNPQDAIYSDTYHSYISTDGSFFEANSWQQSSFNQGYYCNNNDWSNYEYDNSWNNHNQNGRFWNGRCPSYSNKYERQKQNNSSDSKKRRSPNSKQSEKTVTESRSSSRESHSQTVRKVGSSTSQNTSQPSATSSILISCSSTETGARKVEVSNGLKKSSRWDQKLAKNRVAKHNGKNTKKGKPKSPKTLASGRECFKAKQMKKSKNQRSLPGGTTQKKTTSVLKNNNTSVNKSKTARTVSLGRPSVTSSAVRANQNISRPSAMSSTSSSVVSVAKLPRPSGDPSQKESFVQMVKSPRTWRDRHKLAEMMRKHVKSAPKRPVSVANLRVSEMFEDLPPPTAEVNLESLPPQFQLTIADIIETNKTPDQSKRVANTKRTDARDKQVGESTKALLSKDSELNNVVREIKQEPALKTPSSSSVVTGDCKNQNSEAHVNNSVISPGMIKQEPGLENEEGHTTSVNASVRKDWNRQHSVSHPDISLSHRGSPQAPAETMVPKVKPKKDRGYKTLLSCPSTSSQEVGSSSGSAPGTGTLSPSAAVTAPSLVWSGQPTVTISSSAGRAVPSVSTAALTALLASAKSSSVVGMRRDVPSIFTVSGTSTSSVRLTTASPVSPAVSRSPATQSVGSTSGGPMGNTVQTTSAGSGWLQALVSESPPPGLDFTADPPRDVSLSGSTESGGSETISYVNRVLQLSMKEEGVRGAIEAVTTKLDLLQRLILDYNIKFSVLKEKRAQLLKEEESLRSERMKILQEAVSESSAKTHTGVEPEPCSSAAALDTSRSCPIQGQSPGGGVREKGRVNRCVGRSPRAAQSEAISSSSENELTSLHPRVAEINLPQPSATDARFRPGVTATNLPQSPATDAICCPGVTATNLPHSPMIDVRSHPSVTAANLPQSPATDSRLRPGVSATNLPQSPATDARLNHIVTSTLWYPPHSSVTETSLDSNRVYTASKEVDQPGVGLTQAPAIVVAGCSSSISQQERTSTDQLEEALPSAESNIAQQTVAEPPVIRPRGKPGRKPKPKNTQAKPRVRTPRKKATLNSSKGKDSEILQEKLGIEGSQLPDYCMQYMGTLKEGDDKSTIISKLAASLIASQLSPAHPDVALVTRLQTANTDTQMVLENSPSTSTSTETDTSKASTRPSPNIQSTVTEESFFSRLKETFDQSLPDHSSDSQPSLQNRILTSHVSIVNCSVSLEKSDGNRGSKEDKSNTGPSVPGVESSTVSAALMSPPCKTSAVKSRKKRTKSDNSDSLAQDAGISPRSSKRARRSSQSDSSDLIILSSDAENETFETTQNSSSTLQQGLKLNLDESGKKPVQDVSQDNHARVSRQQCRKFSGSDFNVTDIRVFHNHIYVCYNGCSARKFDPESASSDFVQEYRTENIPIMCMAVTNKGRSPSLKRVFLGGDGQILVVFNAETGEQLKTHSFGGKIRCLHCRWGYVFIGLNNGAVIAFDLKEDQPHGAYRCASKAVSAISSATEGVRKVICVASHDSSIGVYDASSGMMLRTLGGHTGVPNSMQAKNRQLVSVSGDGRTLVHDICTGVLDLILTRTSGYLSAVLIIDVEKQLYIVTAGYDKFVRFYNLKTEKLEQMYYGAGYGVLTCIGVYGNKILTGNRDGLVEAIPFDTSTCCPCEVDTCAFVFGLYEHMLHHMKADHQLVPCSWKSCDQLLSTTDETLVADHMTRHLLKP